MRLTKRIRSVNAKILNTERALGKDNRVVKYIYKTVELATDKKGATRLSLPKDYSLRKLAKLERALDKLDSSKWLTKAGRKAMTENARKSFALSHEDLSDREVLDFMYFFEQDLYSKLREIEQGQSEIVIDAISDMRKSGLSRKKVLNAIDDYIKNNNDISFREFADRRIFNEKDSAK